MQDPVISPSDCAGSGAHYSLQRLLQHQGATATKTPGAAGRSEVCVPCVELSPSRADIARGNPPGPGLGPLHGPRGAGSVGAVTPGHV